MDEEEFESIRADGNPVSQARRATALLTTYTQRAAELARLRKVAIDRAYAAGMTYTEIAAQIGLSKGRITQLRKSAPPAERVFFGVGPVTVAIPLRAIGDRPLGVVAAEDAKAAEVMSGILESLSLAVDPFQIPPTGEWDPPADAVAICGPKSSRVTAEAIESDPFLSFKPDDSGRWVITDRQTGETFISPWDTSDRTRDIAYVARLRRKGRTLLVVAGVHALGSVGAVEHLRHHLPDLYAEVGERPFSLVVASTFDGTTPTETTALWGPKVHP
ncbi:hypothetical protein L1785_12230 [Antribacter sp. KLBMP9083]|uniref:Sigma-70 family RNA polymerase sigma factor n=1 Tax=Antribacter soli TaxID=2910976 RepID=A0AA41QEP1_9MICO|nr:hypothetical protein [Antribacter soli]MCF4121751.1 hypothetical protein [Antribacter soli]